MKSITFIDELLIIIISRMLRYRFRASESTGKNVSTIEIARIIVGELE